MYGQPSKPVLIYSTAVVFLQSYRASKHERLLPLTLGLPSKMDGFDYNIDLQAADGGQHCSSP
jgi:hypothetical protein